MEKFTIRYQTKLYVLIIISMQILNVEIINVRSIKLFPIIENVEKPHYPDKKYQEISWNYCKKVLMDYFHFEGQTVKRERSETFYYNFENMEIYTRLITKGQEEYTGGYIVIEMCRRMF